MENHEEFDDKNLETAAVAALRYGGRDILGSAIDSWHNWSRDSYNTPDFTSKPVELDARAAGNEIMSDKRIPTKVR